MFFDKMHHLKDYKGLHPNLDLAIDFILGHDFGPDDLGTHELADKKVFYFIQDNTLNQEPSKEFEFHKKYLDLHFLLEGKEKIKYGTEIESIVQPYDESIDFASAWSRDQVVFTLKSSNFIAFLPGELHQPNVYAGQGEEVHKCVFKVLMD